MLLRDCSRKGGAELKKLWIVILAVLFLWNTGTCMAEDPATVTVNGTATVKVPADRAQIYLGVETRAETAGEASRENAERMNTLIRALLESGIEQEKIVTQNYAVNSIYDYSSAVPAVTGYTVSNMLVITVEDVSRIGGVIDTGLASGANQCNGITFMTTQEQTAKDEALRAAIAEGYRRATIAAEACGCNPGELVSMQETFSSFGGVVNSYAMDKRSDATEIYANHLEYTANVTITLTVYPAAE